MKDTWIKIADKKPEDQQDIIFIDDDDCVHSGFYDADDESFIHFEDITGDYLIKYWQPIITPDRDE